MAVRLFLVAVLGLAAFAVFAALFMPAAGYMVAADQFAAPSGGPWLPAYKTDYIRNRGMMLRRGASGEVVLPVPDDMHLRSVKVSYYTFGPGRADIALSAGTTEIGSSVVEADSRGRQRRLILPANHVVDGEKPLRLRVTDNRFRNLVVDQVTVHSRDGRVYLGLAGQALAAVAALVAALALCSRLIVRPPVSSKRSWLYIDQMRGLAILLVLVLHASGYSGLPAFAGADGLKSVVYRGGHGVELFYLVSAFTLTLSLVHMIGAGHYSYRAFIHNRFLRIVPVFVLVFALAMALKDLIVLAPKPLSLGNVLDNLFLAHIFDATSLRNPINHPVWWSIATEFQFYVLLPFIVLAILATPRRARPASLALLALAAVSLSLWAEFAWRHIHWVNESVLLHADAFALGVVAGMIFVKADRTPWFRAAAARIPGSARITLFGVLAALFVIILAQPVADWLPGRWLEGLPIGVRINRASYLIAAFLLLSYLLVGRFHARTGASILANIGILSFVVYLVHIPAIRIAKDLFPPHFMAGEEVYYLYILCLGLALSLLVALVFHRLVESPVLGRFKAHRVGRGALAVSSLYLIGFLGFTLYRAISHWE